MWGLPFQPAKPLTDLDITLERRLKHLFRSRCQKSESPIQEFHPPRLTSESTKGKPAVDWKGKDEWDKEPPDPKNSMQTETCISPAVPRASPEAMCEQNNMVKDKTETCISPAVPGV